MGFPRCPKCKVGLVGASRTMRGRSRWCCESGCGWWDFEPEAEIRPWPTREPVIVLEDTQPPVLVKQQGDDWTTLIGRFDDRPGNYYVAAHPEHKRPHECFYLIAGPFQSHREACKQLRPVRDIVERLEPAKAFGVSWITARTEVDDIRPTPLGLGQRRDVGAMFRDEEMTR